MHSAYWEGWSTLRLEAWVPCSRCRSGLECLVTGCVCGSSSKEGDRSGECCKGLGLKASCLRAPIAFLGERAGEPIFPRGLTVAQV